MTPDSARAHEATYRRLMDAVGAGREDEVEAVLAAEFVDHNPIPGQASGPAGFRQWLRAVRGAFPDLTATVQDVVAESDRLAGRVRYRGTHRGSFVGLAPTGREVDFEAFHFVRFRDSTIVEWWGTADLLTVVGQVGGGVVGPDGP